MKKNVLILGAVALTAFASCKKEGTETSGDGVSVQETTTQETEAPAASTDSIRTDGTSVSVGADGIQVDSRDGNNQTSVDVSAEGGSVETRK